MPKLKKILKNMVLITLTIKILGFFYKILCARYFPFEVLAIIALLNPILNLSIVLSSMSMPILVNQFISKNKTLKSESNRQFISNSVYITFISTTLIIIIFSLVTFILDKYLYKTSYIFRSFLIMSPLLYFSNFSGIIKSYMEANNEFMKPILSNLLESIIKFFIMMIVILIFKDKSTLFIISMISIGLVIQELSSFTYLIFKTKKRTKLSIVKSTKYNKYIIKNASMLTIFQLVLTIFHFLEPIIYYFFTTKIGYLKEDSLSIYTKIHSYFLPLLQLSSFVTYIIIKISFPKMASFKDNIEVITLFKKIYKKLLIFEVTIFLLILFYGKNLLSILFKENENYQILYIIALSNLICFISPVITTIFQARNILKSLLKNSIISIICSLFILIITSLIPKISLYSIVFCIISSDLIYFFLNYIDLKKEFNIKPNYLYLIKSILTILISVLVGYIINNEIFSTTFSILSFLLLSMIINNFTIFKNVK